MGKPPIMMLPSPVVTTRVKTHIADVQVREARVRARGIGGPVRMSFDVPRATRLPTASGTGVLGPQCLIGSSLLARVGGRADATGPGDERHRAR